ncbi:uncharacterized protein LOC142571885 isoform X2 [Dermacentor variabilis]|uniref:uncharacterized protein LOC142571885 isoform X2 n=1 Tax=Dermacentor variabilis TaxID=34621 RepID=UPI003F5B0772
MIQSGARRRLREPSGHQQEQQDSLLSTRIMSHQGFLAHHRRVIQKVQAQPVNHRNTKAAETSLNIEGKMMPLRLLSSLVPTQESLKTWKTLLSRPSCSSTRARLLLLTRRCRLIQIQPPLLAEL